MARRRRYSGIGGRVSIDRGDTLGGTIPLIMKDQVKQGNANRRRFLKRENQGGFGRFMSRLFFTLLIVAGLGAAGVLAWGVVGPDFQNFIAGELPR